MTKKIGKCIELLPRPSEKEILEVYFMRIEKMNEEC